MILVIGPADDPVIARLLRVLRQDRMAHALLDTRVAKAAQVQAPRSGTQLPWRVAGCVVANGSGPATAVFVRPARSVPAGRTAATVALWTRIERLLLSFEGPVMNRLSSGAGNYAKVHQLLALGAAGFTVPRTSVATLPKQALGFMLEQGADVMSKGLSNAKTIPRQLGARDVANIDSIRHCPLQMQQVVRGRETRLTVIGARAFASQPTGSGFNNVDAAEVFPEPLVRRCIAFVADQGLMLGGYDLCEALDGIYCFEMNHTPLISHYDSDASPALIRAVIDCLTSHASDAPGILV